MLFNSIDFAIFLPTVFLIHWCLSRFQIRAQNGFLLISSYLFYGYWDWRFLGLIVFSSLVDYTVGINISLAKHKSHKKSLLLISILVNLGLLGFFKYYNFFAESFSQAFTILNVPIEVSSLNIILPVGISFYTFQTLSYTIDIYKKKLQPTHDIIAFFALVSFFPQLVAGPIERATNLLPQFSEKKLLLYKNVSEGVKLIVWGMFLKVVVADRAAIFVNSVFNNVNLHQGLDFIVATFLFSFQIYGDFAGYSLIAIGTAKLFNFSLMKNFNRPYFAASITEFWSRWHISLSTWFRDYVYIPLGGNRGTRQRVYLNLFITFVISGLWHGANWTFIVWGAINGFYIVVETAIQKKKRHGILNILFTFLLTNFAWIFFRANSLGDALYIIKTIAVKPGRLSLGMEGGIDATAVLYAFLAIAILLVVEISKEYFNRALIYPEKRYALIRMSLYGLVIFLICYMGVFGGSQFIYFQF